MTINNIIELPVLDSQIKNKLDLKLYRYLQKLFKTENPPIIEMAYKDGDWRYLQRPYNVEVLLKHFYSVKKSILDGKIYLNGNPLTTVSHPEIQSKLCQILKIGQVDYVHNSLVLLGEQNQFNPLADMINSLEKTHEYDFSRTLIDFLGVEDTDWHRLITRKWMLQTLSRALYPGCKADTILILKSGEGTGKSTFFEVLNIEPQYYNNKPIDLDSQWASLPLQNHWIYELAELKSFAGKDARTIKSFVTTATDKVILKNQNVETEFPRSVSFSGTTNDCTFLPDDRYNRRFLVVECGRLNRDLENQVKNIWANVRDFVKGMSLKEIGVMSAWNQEEQEILGKANEDYKSEHTFIGAVLEKIEMYESDYPGQPLKQSYFSNIESSSSYRGWLKNEFKGFMELHGYEYKRLSHERVYVKRNGAEKITLTPSLQRAINQKDEVW